MSKTVDERVVEMRFDNQQFERNVQTSMSTLDKLKSSLNFDGAAKGLENLNTATKGFNMSGISSAVETVHAKFSAFEVMAITALTNITNSAVNAGKRIVESLTIAPISQGFSEYELKMGSVQTIMASTGESLETVNQYLEELNHYADKTIYSFSDMTSNIGKFTNAGVKLEDAVKAIQGVSNEAAISGANANEASRAMYNFAQALSAGYVKLIDWKSIENANMATMEFKQQLIETAVAMGTVVKVGDKYQSTTTDLNGHVSELFDSTSMFNDSLSSQWMTSEVLVQTLGNYSSDIREMSAEEKKAYEEKLKTIGYTEEQIKKIEELGQKAFDSAQDVKTYHQLMDTLAEAVGSGWAQTWEIIFGDFEEAKELWTSVSTVVGGFIDAQSDARNALLQGWKDLGGRTKMVEALKNAFEGFVSLIKPAGDALKEIFPSVTSKDLYTITENLANFTSRLKISGKTADNLKSTFKGFFAILDIGGQAFSAVFKGVKSLVSAILPLGEGILDVTGGFGDWLVQLDNSVRKSDVFNKSIAKVSEVITGMISKVKDFLAPLKERVGLPALETVQEMFKNLETRMTSVGDVANGLKTAAVNVINQISSAFSSSNLTNVLQTIWGFLTKIGGTLLSLAGGAIGKLFDQLSHADFSGILDLLNALSVGGLAVVINKIFGGLKDGVSFENLFKGFDGFKTSIIGTLDQVKDAFSAWQNDLKAGTLMKIAEAIAILAGSLLVMSMIDSGKLNEAIGGMTMLFTELVGSMAVLSKVDVNGKGVSTAANSMVKIAAAMLVAAIALKKLGDMDMGQIGRGLLGLAGLATIMTASVAALEAASNKFNAGKLKGLFAFATSMLLLTFALKNVADLNIGQIGQGLIAIGGLASIMAITIATLEAASNEYHEGKLQGLFSFAVSIGLLTISFKAVSDMSVKEIIKGLTGIGGLAVIMGGTIIALEAASNKWKDGSVKGLLSFAASIGLLTISLNAIGNLNTEQIIKGMAGVAGLATIMGVTLGALTAVASSFDSNAMLKAAASMLVMSSAILVLTPAVMALGSMSLSSIAKALGTLAGAFTILGVAGAVLGPITPAILSLSGAIALIGVGTLAAGAGLLAFAAGITALGGALAAGSAGIIAAINIIVSGVIMFIPNIIAAFGEGIIKLCKVIAEGAPAIGEAFKAVILTLVDVLVECVPAIADGAFKMVTQVLDTLVTYGPQIVDSLLTFVIQLIEGLAARMPELIQAGVDLVMSFFAGIVEALKGVDVNVLVNGIAGIGIMSAIMVALGAVAALVPSAMVGVLGMGAVIAELAIVLAAVGALAQIPGLNWLIGEGGKLLQSIGTAIGSFVGGIVGGFMGGVSAQFPKIGSDLSAFMDNVKPFIEGASSIDNTLMTGVTALADAILVLTAADILNGIASFFTGGSSLADFGNQLVPFGQAMKDFSDTIAGMDSELVVNASTAGKALAEMASTIPSTGGLFSFFSGEKDLSAFGEQLVAFGAAMLAYSVAIRGLNTDAITNSVTAGNALIELAGTVPNTGGLISFLTGDNDMATFGEQLVSFGSSMKAYSDAVSGIDAEAIANSAVAGQALSELANSLPNTGGIVSWFTGDNDFSAFGESLVSFGNSLSSYSQSIAGIDTGKMSSVITQVQSLLNLAKGMSGVDFTGMSNFSAALTRLGQTGVNEFIAAFTNATGRVKQAASSMITEFIASVNERRNDLVTAFKSSIEEVLSEIEGMRSRFVESAKSLVDEMSNTVNAQSQTVSNAFVRCIEEAINAIEGLYDSFYSAGGYLAEGLAEGIDAKSYLVKAKAKAMATSAANAAKRALDEHSPSKVGYEIGDYFGIAFVTALDDYAEKAYRSGFGIGDSTKSGLTKAISRASDLLLNGIDAQPTIRPVFDLTEIQNGASAINGYMSSLGGYAIAGTVDIANRTQSEMSRAIYSDDDTVSLAIKDLKRAILDLVDSPRTTENIFNIQGRDPKEIGDYVYNMLQHDTERRGETWA